MALGKRKDEQQEMWVATTSLPKWPSKNNFHFSAKYCISSFPFHGWESELCRMR